MILVRTIQQTVAIGLIALAFVTANVNDSNAQSRGPARTNRVTAGATNAPRGQVLQNSARQSKYGATSHRSDSNTRVRANSRQPSAVRTASTPAHLGAVRIGQAVPEQVLAEPMPQLHGNSVIADDDAVHVGNEEAAMHVLAPQACNYPCDPMGALLDWSRADLWLGVSGFSGPSNFITSGSNSSGQVEGSFGFHEGINLGSSLPSLLCGQLGGQVGVRAVQAQLDGSAASADSRNQFFLTGGLFRRVDYGFQGGLVVDYLHDDWFYQADLLQLRGELSFLLTPCHDLGFRFTSNEQTESVQAFLGTGPSPVTVDIATLETYRFFYRYLFGDCGRGQAEFNIGFTEDRDTMLGTQISTPLQGQLGLQTTATYMIPRETASPAYASEAWNIGLAIVWTPGRGFGGGRDYYRPLFDVADNGSLIGRIVR